MTIQKILLMGNAQLLQRSELVADPTSPEIKQLAVDMLDTLESVSGIGLAAPQIGVHKRVVVFCLPPSRIPEGAKTKPIPWTTMINPTVEPQGEACIELWERCLSVPGLYARVPRFAHSVVRYTTLDGKSVTRECRGYTSALLQHECDHLNGILYPHRLPNARGLTYAAEVCEGGAVYKYSPREFDGD